MTEGETLYDLVGGAEGFERLAGAFYARVAGDALLRPIYPPGRLDCPTKMLARFLVQSFGVGLSFTVYDFSFWRFLGGIFLRIFIEKFLNVGHVDAHFFRCFGCFFELLFGLLVLRVRGRRHHKQCGAA